MPEVATRPLAAGRGGDSLSGAAVHSVAVALPEGRLGNSPIAGRLGVNEEWIVSRTGVRERRVAGEGERVYGLAAEAGAETLVAADVDPREVDLVVVATMSHDQLTPSAAALVAAEVGADGAGALDVNAACAGFVSALATAVALVESNRTRKALVIGADILRPLTDPDDRATAALFGDGAGAVLVTATDPPGMVGPAVLGSDGRNADLVRAPRERGYIEMKGPDTFRHAVDRLVGATERALANSGQSVDDIDLFAYHQANSRIVSAVGERLGLRAERVIDCIAEYGNTSAASIPIALAEAERRAMLRPGSRVLIAGFGGGLAWAAMTLVWGRNG